MDNSMLLIDIPVFLDGALVERSISLQKYKLYGEE